ncbi:UPF0046 protein T07D4.2-like isoform X1 [Centruroides sculpturatus]|uniref:UPF0046 protein T07D4.2-like isoform X1 n=1 Tax=Centruroides sculpturatus TaxID=218467 RepID=UPI000C6E4815|nr:UPF0046 protein T07D4.2-like isoform X1 [Centruroides sculpturatus]
MTSENEIKVHPLTKNPSAAWESFKPKQTAYRIKHLPIDLPISHKAIRFVCMSDTHSLLSRRKFKIPPGDVFIHAGDFTRHGGYNEIIEFNNFLGNLSHKHKIVIAGNHELTFDQKTISSFEIKQAKKATGQDVPLDTAYFKNLLTNCIYLEDSLTEVYNIKIYGTPWQPEYNNWAFNLPRGKECLEKWNMIPSGVDVLITHTPPVGHGDLCILGRRVGCVELLQTVQNRIKPKYHVFGHIHEGYGITTDGKTIFVNASTCNISYEPVNLPIIFDIILPKDQTKE